MLYYKKAKGGEKMNREEYLSSLTFGLKDYLKTWKNYHDYKRGKWEKWIKKNKTLIKIHLSKLPSDIVEEFKTGMYKSLEVNINRKQDIKLLRNHVNYATFVLNEKFCRDNLGAINNNEVRCFATKLYLEYYDEMNLTMYMTFRKIVDDILEGEL